MIACALVVIFLASIVANEINTNPIDDGWAEKSSLRRRPTDYQKTLDMAKYLFQGNAKTLITAPRGFSKTTNLMMLKDYYERNDTRTPVLFVNLFAHETVTTQPRVFELLREKIHLVYLDHVYLTSSSRLDAREKEICERWCSLRFTELSNHAVSVGLTHLTRCMYRHWNRRVVVLVDEYDSLVMNALHSASNMEFRPIVQLVYSQISKLVKYNNFVSRVLITGESFLAGAELASKNDIDVYRFLGDHPMVDKFGLSCSELEKLLKNRTDWISVKDRVRKWYGGYTTKGGLSVYNPVSVYNFLQDGIFKGHWRENRHIYIVRLLQISFIEQSVKTMLQYECAPISLVNWANIDVLFTLKSFLENVPESPHHEAVHDLFFTYLFDQGYFSFGRNDSSCIVIPNLEVDQALSQILKEHYVRKHKLNPYMLEECAKSINHLYHHVQDGQGSFKTIMDELFKALESLFRDYRYYYGTDISSEEDLTEIMFALANCAPDFVTKSKLKTEYLDENNKTKKGSVDLYLYKGSLAIVIELSHAKSKSPNSKASIQRILDRRYYNVMNNSLYTPQKIDHFLLVGLSTNNKAILSLSSLLDSKNISEISTVRKLQRLPVKVNRNVTRNKNHSTQLKRLKTSPIRLINVTTSPETS